MAVVDAYTPITALLVNDDEANGLRSIINAVSSGLVPAGAVEVSRQRFTASKRGGKTRPGASVAVVPVVASPPEQVGIGVDRHEEVFDVELVQNGKALASGATPLATVRTMTRAVVEGYHGRANITLSGVTLLGVTAELIEADTDPESVVVRAVVRLRWRYSQTRRSNG